MAYIVTFLLIVSIGLSIVVVYDTRRIRELKLENKAHTALINAYEPLRIKAVMSKNGAMENGQEDIPELSQKKKKATKPVSKGKR